MTAKMLRHETCYRNYLSELQFIQKADTRRYTTIAVGACEMRRLAPGHKRGLCASTSSPYPWPMIVPIDLEDTIVMLGPLDLLERMTRVRGANYERRWEWTFA